MKVILTQDIKSVGKKGQIIDASDGYARNFLLPKKMAVIADATNLNELKTKQDANKYKHDMTMANAKELSEKMKNFELVFKIKAGENGKIFGSVTSKDIADELNVTSSYLSKLFSKETGQSISVYIKEEKLKAAANMLQYSDLSITDISEYYHFASQSHFTASFTEYYKITPKKYRDKYNKKICKLTFRILYIFVYHLKRWICILRCLIYIKGKKGFLLFVRSFFIPFCQQEIFHWQQSKKEVYVRITQYKTIKDEIQQISLIKESAVNYPTSEKMDKPQIIVKMMNTVFQSDIQTEEYLHMLCFDSAMHLIGVFEISHGTVNASLVSPREIFQKALLCNAVQIILVHNHPSGDVSPSKQDMTITQQVKESGSLLCVPLLDHIIIGNGYFSFYEKGAL